MTTEAYLTSSLIALTDVDSLRMSASRQEPPFSNR
jgi:hypothetical protein